MTKVGLETQKRKPGMSDRIVNSGFTASESNLTPKTPRRIKQGTKEKT